MVMGLLAIDLAIMFSLCLLPLCLGPLNALLCFYFLLAGAPAMMAQWLVTYLFWVSSAHLLHLYLLLLSWAYWPLFLPYQHIEFTTLFIGLSRPIYLFFTSYCSHGFTTSFLGLPRPTFLFLLLLVTFMGLLAIIPTISIH